ncbi:TonB-dependent receptor [Parapedobacter sp. SGR-10]|uniref:TonB-dependent receptor n=1 Tax=Parapedobacter sp. SGR-10 TaxID=2710879 RepID=UPI0013D7A4EC|nr:TonB-dependent receptor [Parapedobacter sp. SGR-10]NGF55207.1 TonB-dependent receptor [Parapedobacter sp. SGR-10]
MQITFVNRPNRLAHYEKKGNPYSRWFPLRLRVITWLLVTSISYAAANTLFAQQLNLKLEKVSLQHALNEVKKQSKYINWYEGGAIVSDVPVTINAKNISLKHALSKIFDGQPYTYNIVGETIVVKRKKEDVPAIAAASPLQEIITVEGRVRLAGKQADASHAGISVRERGSSSSAITDKDGNFKIRVRKNAALIFTMLGYSTREVNIGVVDKIDIELQEELSKLDEVVVTGYTVQERREITGAISQIKAKDIESMPIQTFDQAMQGRMAGVNVSSATGVPGGAVRVQIRGEGSISAGNDPLYIVDGIPVNSEDASTVTSSNPLSFLNPKDIESIEVLKDAAAASIYGAQAANGVVLITTKSGAAGPTVVNVEYNQGLVTPMPLIETMNTQQFIQGRMEAKRNYYPEYSYEQVRSEVLNELQLPIGMTDAEIMALPSYDWQSAAFRNGLSSVLNLSAQGGAQRTTFRVAASYENNQGSVVGTKFQRGTASLRLNHQVNSRLSFRADADLTMLKQEGAIGTSGSYLYLSSPQYSAPLMLPFLSIYNSDGSYNLNPQGFPGTFRYHAIAAADMNDYIGKTNTLLARLRADYKIKKNLNLRSYIGVHYSVNVDNQFQDPRTNEAQGRRGILTINQRYPVSFTTTHHLTYNKTFAKYHKVTALGGLEYRTYSTETFRVQGDGFPSYRFRTLQSASTINSATGSYTAVRRMGVFGQVNYNYRNRYMLSGILRYDGSSRFGDNHLFGWFPAISGGWDAAQEDFLKSVQWLNQLKLRVGYGETGNDRIGNFTARSLYGTTQYDGQGGTVPTRLGNDDLRWERNTTTNIGLDYSMLNRRIYGSVEVYRRISKDLLLTQPIPWVSGYAEISRNVGEVKNEGIEFEINVNPVRSSRFNWTSGFNISFIKNRVTKLYGDLASLPGRASIRVGYSLHTNFLNQYAGVNSATGRPMWYAADGSYSYRPGAQGSESYTLRDRGNRLSDYYGGWNNNFKYKSFQLDVLLHYDMGRELYNNMARIMSRKGDVLVNGAVWYYDNRWTAPGQITSVPRPIDGATELNALAADGSSTRFLEDASYIRLKHINFSYDIPSSFASRLKISNARVFFQALNVMTWTKWTGYDPEFYIDESNFESNAGIVPQTRTYNLGVQFKF